MKKLKIFWIINLFICYFSFIFTAKASDYYFIWSDTTVIVPLYGNLSEYIYKPTAKLYENGVLKKDANISYLRDGFDLYFLEDVDTTTVGKYLVMYKAYDYNLQTGNCDGYSQLITFDVKDLVYPTINLIKTNIKLSYTVQSYDYSSLFTVYDNSKTLSYIWDDSNIKYGVVGDYVLDIYANDGYNITQKHIDVKIVDEVPPKIDFCYANNILSVDYKENIEIDFSKYFICSDEYCSNVIQNLVVDFKDYSIGVHNLIAYVTDDYENEAFCEFILEIKDTIKPELQLISKTIDIDYNNLNDIDLKKYIKKVEDNVSNLTVDDVNITSPTIDKIGTYEIKYSIKDENNNETLKYLILNVKKYDGPNISVINPTINVGEEFDILKYVTVYDETDPNALNTLKIIDSNLDLFKEGIYYLNISASNSSGNLSYATILVTVKETSKTKDDFAVKPLAFLVLGSTGVLVIYLFIKKSRRKK